MIRIDVNIDDDQLVEGLAALARQGEDASPIMRGLAGIMRSAAEDAFDLERDPVTGAAWPPLNAAYKKKRYEDGYTGKILSRTGRMQQTLSVRYGRDFALVGVSAPYAAAHQFGARTRAHIIRAHHPGSVIPPRPFLGVGEDHKTEMRRLIVRHLRKAVRGA